MPSIYYIERNGIKYAYQSTSKRVPGKKSPVTEKIYLGKVDPETGNIIPKENRTPPKEEYVKDYGSIAVLDKVQDDLGLFEDLKACFPDIAEKIMAAAISQCLEATPFSDIEYIIDGSTIAEIYKLRGNLSSATMSELSKELGQRLSSMDHFFTQRVKRSADGKLILDLTSVSSYSDMKGYSEWGHNRDGEDLRQTGIALVTDGRGIPMVFSMLPGSIADSTVLESTVEYLEDLGCSGRFVMDRGFENAHNVNSLLQMNVLFTMPSNIREEPIKKLLTRAASDMKSSEAFRFHEGNTYKVAEYEVGVVSVDGKDEYIVEVPRNHKDSAAINSRFATSRKFRAFVVFDPKKASNDLDAVMEMVSDIELKYENTKPRDPAKVYSKLPAFVRRYVDYSVDEEGFMHIERKQNSFTFADNRAGYFVMFASEGTAWEQMMSSYDVRDWVEKAFDVYKTDLDGSRSRTGNPDSARGRLFIKFIAMIMRIEVQNILRDHDKETLRTKNRKDSVNGKTVDELFRTLSTVSAIGFKGNWRLSHISKGAREAFRLFGLDEPKSGRISLS